MPLRGFLEWIARSAASAPHALRHRLRSGPTPFRPRSVQAPSPQAPPEPSLRGAFTARSLCCAGAFARRAFAPPLAPNPSLPCSRLPSLRGAVTAVTEGCCQRLCSVCNFLLLPQFRAFFRYAAPPSDGDEKVAPLLVGSSLTPPLAVTIFRGAECHCFVFYLYFQHKSAII